MDETLFGRRHEIGIYSQLRHIIFDFLYFVSAHSPHNSHKSCFLFLRIYTQTPRYKNQPLFAAEHAVARSLKNKNDFGNFAKKTYRARTQRQRFHRLCPSHSYLRSFAVWDWVRCYWILHAHAQTRTRSYIFHTESVNIVWKQKHIGTCMSVCVCVCLYAYNTTHWLPHRVCMSVHTVRDILLACNHLSTTLSYSFR